jgi:hypothetical protein
MRSCRPQSGLMMPEFPTSAEFWFMNEGASPTTGQSTAQPNNASALR